MELALERLSHIPGPVEPLHPPAVALLRHPNQALHLGEAALAAAQPGWMPRPTGVTAEYL